jgi:hypothetical protein
MKVKQPWLYSPLVDFSFILLPPFLITLFVVLLLPLIGEVEAFPNWLWFVLIVGVDVSHVYGTLFRTYFDREEVRTYGSILVAAPLVGFCVGCGVYSMNPLFFWRLLAYAAVFHFVRQQYGFLMLYSVGGAQSRWEKRIDALAVYAACLLPLLYWHTTPREFSWFVKGDFLYFSVPAAASLCAGAYLIVGLLYAVKELGTLRKGSSFNVPKNLVLLGTGVSWFVGIVAINNDIAFTAINVISHGVPYLALIWIHGRNQSEVQSLHEHTYYLPVLRYLFKPILLPSFLLLLLGLATLEEYLWDGFVWHERVSLFGSILSRNVSLSNDTLTLLVPLLALPQFTHYILDGYIWRVRGGSGRWKELLLLKRHI